MQAAAEAQRCALTLVIVLAGVSAAQADDAPLSSIDWLSHSIAVPANQDMLGQAPIRGVGGIEDIAMRSLAAPSANRLGLLSTSRTGLPADLWGSTPEPRLVQMLRAVPINTLPALQQFLMTLLLAEFDPPGVPAPDAPGQLFFARVDRLLDMGALEQAHALLEQANPTDPQVFRRRFDVALLLGQENRACRIMDRTPAIAPSYAARVFCLARTGQWETAVLIYGTGKALGQIRPAEEELIARFLDPGLADGAPDLPPPDPMTPLRFKMMEAIGQPLSTQTLPLAFARADLGDNNGWKAQLDAAERLARAGVLDPNRLLGLYTAHKAAASGGVWERVRAISSLDRAISDNDRNAIRRALPTACSRMAQAELEPVLAALYGSRLARMNLGGQAGKTAFSLGLLSADYGQVALDPPDQDAHTLLLAGIARGSTRNTRAPDTLAAAIKTVFDALPTDLPDRYRALVPGRLGAALLEAIEDVTEGAKGDYPRLQDGLRLLRMTAGLDPVARRTALELMVLERRG